MKNGMHRTAADFKLVHLNMTCKQGWCSRLSLSAAFMQLPRETWSCEPCSQSYWALCLMKVCPRDPRACEFAHVSVTLFSLSARSGWCAHELWSCKSVLKINISRILSSHYVHAFAIWKHLRNNTRRGSHALLFAATHWDAHCLLLPFHPIFLPTAALKELQVIWVMTDREISSGWWQMKREPNCRMVKPFWFFGHKILTWCTNSQLSYVPLVTITQWISSLASEGHNIRWNMGVLKELSDSLWKAEETSSSQYLMFLRLLQQSLL